MRADPTRVRDVVLEQPVLGLMQALALGQPYDVDVPATPEFTALKLGEQRFELDVRVWPTHGRHRPRDLQVQSGFSLGQDGVLTLSAKDARWLKQKGDPPDLKVLLFGDKLLGGLVAAMSTTLPGARTQSVAGVDLAAATTSVSTSDGVVLIGGTLSATEVVHQAAPAGPTAGLSPTRWLS